MSLTAIVELLIKPELVEAYAARLGSALPQTRAADGCLEITAYRDQQDPRRIVIIERWEARSHYDAYIEWRRSTGVLEKLGAVLERPMTVQFLDALA
jgi:quinol monooxygenase YgiN